jgi:hypothetical protein
MRRDPKKVFGSWASTFDEASFRKFLSSGYTKDAPVESKTAEIAAQLKAEVDAYNQEA